MAAVSKTGACLRVVGVNVEDLEGGFSLSRRRAMRDDFNPGQSKSHSPSQTILR